MEKWERQGRKNIQAEMMTELGQLFTAAGKQAPDYLISSAILEIWDLMEQGITEYDGHSCDSLEEHYTQVAFEDAGAYGKNADDPAANELAQAIINLYHTTWYAMLNLKYTDDATKARLRKQARKEK